MASESASPAPRRPPTTRSCNFGPTVAALREDLETVVAEHEAAEQRIRATTGAEVRQLQLTIQELRNQLEERHVEG